MAQVPHTAPHDEVRVHVAGYEGVLSAREAAREMAMKLGFTLADTTRVTTAVSEVARNIARFAWSGVVVLKAEHSYRALVLSSRPPATLRSPLPPEPTGITVADVATGAGSAAGAVLLAGAALFRRRSRLLARFPQRSRAVRAARRLQSGVVNDYVTWLVIGVVCIGAALAAAIR